MGKNLKYGEFTFSKTASRPKINGYAMGGRAETKGQAKIGKVMGEFKSGDLHSGSKSGPVVKNPKQAIAIALSEKRAAGLKKGGKVESKSEVKKEVGMLKKVGAPKEMIADEMSEMTRGAKREPDAVVRKEVALLKKAGAPAKLVQSEQTEMPVGGLKRVMLKKGGEAHDDVAMDKKMIKTAVHKHEAAMHPGKPLTKLKKGGVPTHNRKPLCGC